MLNQRETGPCVPRALAFTNAKITCFLTLINELGAFFLLKIILVP